MDAQTEASAVIVSIRAARNAVSSLGFELDGKIMVSGYSQGGHADEFNLVAAAHLAGSYYVSQGGFANPGSLGIMIGGMGAIAPERRQEIVSLGLKAILAGTLATSMRAPLRL